MTKEEFQPIDPYIAQLIVKWAMWIFVFVLVGIVMWKYRRRF